MTIPPAWIEREAEDLFEEYDGNVFDSADQATRRRFETADELAELPLFNPQDEEIPVYSAGGRRIPRRTPVSLDGHWPVAGVLQDLSKIHDLFLAPSNIPINADFDGELHEDRGFGQGLDDDDFIEFEPGDPPRDARMNDIPHTRYPHCFIPTMGQWQAHGFIQPILPLLRQLHGRIRDNQHRGLAVEAVSSQCYNTVAHRLRASARLHLAQTGPLTGVVSGAYARSTKNEAHANDLLFFAQPRLPHTQLAEKIREAGDDQYLRLENVFRCHPHRMDEDIFADVDGFYESVIMPIIDMAAHPSVLTALKATSILLVPEVRARHVLRGGTPSSD